MSELMRQVLATTDITSMAREVGEAYRLTVSLERDIKEIELSYAIEQQLASDLHSEIMLNLERRFAERSEQISLIKEVVAAWMKLGLHEDAKQVIQHLTSLLAGSPIDDAIHQRNSFYRR